jgi:predicted  nucleic acid-binding Zn ribbon protein
MMALIVRFTENKGIIYYIIYITGIQICPIGLYLGDSMVPVPVYRLVKKAWIKKRAKP